MCPASVPDEGRDIAVELLRHERLVENNYSGKSYAAMCSHMDAEPVTMLVLRRYVGGLLLGDLRRMGTLV